MYDLASMSCAYILTGHSDVIPCIDTCVSASGKTLIISGSKDNTVSYISSQIHELSQSLSLDWIADSCFISLLGYIVSLNSITSIG